MELARTYSKLVRGLVGQLMQSAHELPQDVRRTSATTYAVGDVLFGGGNLAAGDWQASGGSPEEAVCAAIAPVVSGLRFDGDGRHALEASLVLDRGRSFRP